MPRLRDRIGAFGPGGVRPFDPGAGFAQAVLSNGTQDSGPVGYAPSYYPSVTNISEASRVTAGLSAAVGGVDFAVRLVPTATVRGVVSRADGERATGTQLMLLPDEGVPTRDSIVVARVQTGGTFEIRAVPPGRYTLRAATRRGGRRLRGGFGERPMFASQRLNIDGFDVNGLALVLLPGATLSGSVVFETTEGLPSGTTSIRVTVETLQNIPLSGNPERRLDEDGTFEMQNVSGGPKLVRARGVPNGWMLKAVYLDSQDVIDTPLEFSDLTRVDGFRVVLTDQVSRITGIIQDREDTPLTDYTVVAFPLDNSLWQPRSRYIKAARPDQNTRYEIKGLPSGNYLVSAVDLVQEDEWFDPQFLQRLRFEGIRMSLNNGESKDLNLALDVPDP